jgi:hypothetical protein
MVEYRNNGVVSLEGEAGPSRSSLFLTGLTGFPTASLRRGEIKGLRIFTATSLRQGYGGQEERKEHGEKIVRSMNPILKILFILSKNPFRAFRVFRGKNY